MPPSRVAAADDEDEDEDGPDCYDVPDDANDEEGKLDQRVILLLDLDCFYAQAVCLRLGYDAAVTSLALFQWNSVLAVTYAARTLYNVKRGDSWEIVRTKSQGQCLCVHVPILTTSNAANAEAEDGSSLLSSQSLLLGGATATATAATSNSNRNSSFNEAEDACHGTETLFLGRAGATIEEEYRDYFQLDVARQREARQLELGVRKYSGDGKASIECFRIASSRILGLVKTFLRQQYHHHHAIVLERASIDEFFLDVTAVVDDQEYWRGDDPDGFSVVPPSTIVVGEASGRAATTAKDDDPDVRLARGCIIADRIRAHVWQELNFTLTAGISINKTIAKLAASYGKPNGQAVCHPRHISTLLQSTPISKCRNLGGKLGALVEKVLAESSYMSTTTTTAPAATAPAAMVGDIVRHLSLPRLLQCGHFSESTARWIWNIAHGRDSEPVQAKDQTAVLTKSITAFKSLNFDDNNDNNNNRNNNGQSLRDIEPWIRLLAQEVVHRVARDEQRNHRYPKSCVIQYTTTTTSNNNNNNNNDNNNNNNNNNNNGGNGFDYGNTSSSKSVRIPFPSAKWSCRQKQDHLVAIVPKTVATKEKDNNRHHVRLRRIGICATDFFPQCSAGASIGRFFTEEACSAAAASSVKSTTMTTNHTPPSEPPDLDLKRRDHVIPAPATATATGTRAERHDEASSDSSSVADRDLALARTLQARYDREEQTLRRLESRKRQKSAGCIDSYFSKRSTTPAAKK